MKNSANEFKFEQAQMYKDKLDILERYQAKSTIVNPRLNDLDVFSIVSETGFACVNYLKIIKGAVVQSYNLEIRKIINETDEELMGFAISEIRRRFGSKSQEILVSVTPDFIIEGCKYSTPIKGDKAKLMDLSKRNSRAYVIEKLNNLKRNAQKDKTNRILKVLKSDLKLSVLPKHIECFDNSNLGGTTPVAACVVFRNAQPSKNEYRHYNIKTVKGADDYASMEEVVYRRYKRLLAQNDPLPQLAIIDGGRGQINSAYKSLIKLGIQNEVQLIGIAERLEIIYKPKESIPLYLNKSSESLKIIQSARNEAHRFGLQFHRRKREKAIKKSSLEHINGIGPKTIEKLYEHFKTYNRIANAKKEELEKIICPHRAALIFKHFNS